MSSTPGDRRGHIVAEAGVRGPIYWCPRRLPCRFGGGTFFCKGIVNSWSRGGRHRRRHGRYSARSLEPRGCQQARGHPLPMSAMVGAGEGGTGWCRGRGRNLPSSFLPPAEVPVVSPRHASGRGLGAGSKPGHAGQDVLVRFRMSRNWRARAVGRPRVRRRRNGQVVPAVSWCRRCQRKATLPFSSTRDGSGRRFRLWWRVDEGGWGPASTAVEGPGLGEAAVSVVYPARRAFRR